jgi:outer membrane protein OmpU
MKKVLFATTATAALAFGGIASAQGIALFGEARLGLGYNINNEGGVAQEIVDNGDGTFSQDFIDDARAVSRVRFGVNMTGESDSGITFGATIRADNAVGGEGDAPLSGQTAGSVFVSGSWGTLTYGDTNAADEQWVGDVPGDYSLTGLTEVDETRFVSNGGSFGQGTGTNFASNPEARPTVRYDFDIAGFGVSGSTNRDLNDIGVGVGYAADFGGGSWSVGLGYYDFQEFTAIDDDFPFATTFVPDGHQWSAGVEATYESFGFGITYTSLDTSENADGVDFEADNLLVGASVGFGAWSVGAVYGNIMSASGGLEGFDGSQAYGLTAEYDLGGGASINGGVFQSYDQPLGTFDAATGDLIETDFDSAVIADFGITMAF